MYEDGTVYGIRYGGQEYSCDTGKLAEGRLTLTTFDFGGGTETLRATRTWKNLRIHEKGSKAVKGARKSLSGKYRKNLKLCADLTYTSVTTNPDPLG